LFFKSRPSAPPAFSAAPRIGRFRLVRLIGRGAVGAVYLAQDGADGQWVALKTLPLTAGNASDARAAQELFERETRAIGLLRHPGIVAVLDAGRADHTGWLALELVAGADLRRYTRPDRLLPERLVVRIGVRVAGALAHAHAQSVLHRDVKPANVLVDWSRDIVKLGDFGVARWADHAQTQSGQAIGSPDYMAPEQLAGADVGPAADLYGLGATLYELLTGRRPHVTPTLGALLRAVARDPVDDLVQLRPDLPQALTQLVMSSLAKHASQRPKSANAMVLTLERAYASPPVDAP
jgi:eukaryotic-like serine/threonine-protein kinase